MWPLVSAATLCAYERFFLLLYKAAGRAAESSTAVAHGTALDTELVAHITALDGLEYPLGAKAGGAVPAAALWENLISLRGDPTILDYDHLPAR